MNIKIEKINAPRKRWQVSLDNGNVQRFSTVFEAKKFAVLNNPNKVEITIKNKFQ